MSDQTQSAKTFTSLHKKGDPVILFNIWDAGSAGAVRDAGAQAIATGSAPVAMAQGFGDGQNIPLEAALDNARRIVAAVDLPVTLDFEGAYAEDPQRIAQNVKRALDCGVVGFNFEDQIIGGDGLYDITVQAKRVEAMRLAEIFRAKVVDTTLNSFIFELTGAPDKIDAFAEMMRPLGLTKIARTGVAALLRGN